MLPRTIAGEELRFSFAIGLRAFFSNSSIFAASTVCCFARSSAHNASAAFLKLVESFINPYFINSHNKSALAIIIYLLIFPTIIGK